MPAKKPAPKSLATAGKKLWGDVTGQYELRIDELRVLEDACHEADLISSLEDGRRESPLMVKGSQGQDVINPMISELRQHRGVLARLLAQLKLPDVEEASAESRSSQARDAANARWQRRGA